MSNTWEQDILDLCQDMTLDVQDTETDFFQSWEHVAKQCCKGVYELQGEGELRLKHHGVIKLNPSGYFDFEGGGSLTVKPMSRYVQGLMNGTIKPDLSKPMQLETTETL